MVKEGAFINYQMVEAINLINDCNINTTIGMIEAEEKLSKLKDKWIKDIVPGYNIEIGNKMAGMQEITIEEILQLSNAVKYLNTYTVQNSGNLQYCLVKNEDGSFDFNFEYLDKIAKFARKNNKKIIIDSAIIFGDQFPHNIKDLDKNTIIKLINLYTKKLTENYGDIIERIDVLNAIYKRKEISPENNSEDFWVEKFGENYAQEVIDIVKQCMNSNYPNIKLCWNEFYLTNSKFEKRKYEFMNKINSISNLDVIGLQDRFISGESIDYIESSLNDFVNLCSRNGKKMCITELSCSVSGKELQKGNNPENIEEINLKIKNILDMIKKCSNENKHILESIEGSISDKFDFNYEELKKYGFNISTIQKKDILGDSLKSNTEINNQKRFYEKQNPYEQMEKTEIIYQQLKQMIQNNKQVKNNQY